MSIFYFNIEDLVTKMKTVVGFLSRSHGYDVLSSLIKSDSYKLLRVYTHSLNPKSQDITRSEREDFQTFKKKCEENNIPLFAIDSKDSDLDDDFPSCDFIVEVSWRYLISKSITTKARIAAFGIHRGKLPEFAGTEPIKQALQAKENEIVLSGHFLEPVIDSGAVIAKVSHPVNYNNNLSLEENVNRLRKEITPLFSSLVLKIFNILERNSY